MNKTMTMLTCGLVGTAIGLYCGLAAAGETGGPVSDPIGVWAIPKGAPILTASFFALSGADTALGTDSFRAIEIAVKQRNGMVVDHPIKLTAEDTGCSAEGAQTAATKAAANPNMVVVVGVQCSNEVLAAAPILWNAGITAVATSATAPSLTAPDRKKDYDGFVRTVYSDADQGAADGKYLHDELKARTLVVVHDGSSYAQQLGSETAKNFQALGGKVLAVEAVQPNDVDMQPLLTRIAASKPDVVYLPLFVSAAAQILRQSKEVPGFAGIQIVGSSSLMAKDMIELAKDAIVDFRITYPDISPEAMGETYPDFVKAYQEEYGEAPISGYHGYAYDAAELVFKAIEKVAVTDADGTTYIGKRALRDAIFAITFKGMSGEIACSEHGQCSKFKPAVYQYTNSDPASYLPGTNPKKIFPQD